MENFDFSSFFLQEMRLTRTKKKKKKKKAEERCSFFITIKGNEWTIPLFYFLKKKKYYLFIRIKHDICFETLL